MFCENCGTRVEDGQPFCPNCGNRMAASAAPAAQAAPAAASYQAPAAPRPAKPVSNDGLLGKFNGQQGLGKIFYPLVCGLWLVCFILSFLKVLTAYSVSAAMVQVSPFFGTLVSILFTLAITFLVLDYFDKFSFKFLWFFLTAAAAVILLIYVIIWIDSGVKQSAGGWFFLILQTGLTALSVLLLLEKLKK